METATPIETLRYRNALRATDTAAPIEKSELFGECFKK